MRIKNLILSMCFVLFSYSSYASVAVIESIKLNTAEKLLKITDSSTIVLVNIENTLTTPVSKMFRFKDNPNSSFIDNLIERSQKVSTFKKTVAAFLQKRKLMLVEAEWSDYIEKLKGTGALVLGVYRAKIKERGLIIDPEDKNYEFAPEKKHYQEIAELGVHFTPQINGQEIIKLENSGNNSFYKGLLFSDTLNKGMLLIELIKATNLSPKKVIAIDASREHLGYIKYALRLFDIEYHPAQYIAVRELEGIPNREVVQLQQNTLINKDIWLEDEEAEELLGVIKTQQQEKNMKN